jgi:hypothetical protein
MPDITKNGRAITPFVRDALFQWLDQQRDAEALITVDAALFLSAGFDLPLPLCRRVVVGWLLVHYGSDRP